MNRNIVYLSMLCVLFLNTLSAQNRTTTTQENVRLLESSVLDSLLLLEEQLSLMLLQIRQLHGRAVMTVRQQ